MGKFVKYDVTVLLEYLLHFGFYLTTLFMLDTDLF